MVRAWALVTRVAREHHRIDDQRVLAGGEELRQGDRAVLAIECVVIGTLAAGRELPALSRNRLHLAPELALALQQVLSRFAVLGGLVGEGNAHLGLSSNS